MKNDLPIKLTVLTEKKELFDARVASVNLPGEDGNFQVLRNHAPWMSVLAAGFVTYRTNTGKERIKIPGGMVRVMDNQVKLLVRG